MARHWFSIKVQFSIIFVGQSMMERGNARPTVAKRICDDLRRQIVEGVYRPGAPVPSTRALAAELGISRTTATAAYDQLLAEGFLQARQGAKTVVAPTLELTALRPKPVDSPRKPIRLSRYGRSLARLPARAGPPSGKLVADFRYGELSGHDFPSLAWKRALNKAAMRRPQRLRYDDPAGSYPLRSALQAYLWRTRGLRCETGQIVVVNGSQQGLDLCARVFVEPGDTVVVEDPCYALARQVLTANGAAVVPVQVDSHGMRTERLRSIASARLCYVTPSHQFPLGGVMSLSRRQELLAWAHRTNAYVIEDDYDGEYRFDVDPIRPLQAIGNMDNVVYLGTISKTLSPTIRLGYMVVPANAQPIFANAKLLADRHAPLLEQEALADFIASGAYERHIRRVRRRNAERRAALLEALTKKLATDVMVVGADAGLHVVAWFNEVPRQDEAALVERAAAADIAVYPITPLYGSAGVSYRPKYAGLVLGYASLDRQQIERGVDRLAGVLRRP